MDRKKALKTLGLMGIGMAFFTRAFGGQDADGNLLTINQPPYSINFDMKDIKSFIIEFEGEKIEISSKEIFEALKK